MTYTRPGGPGAVFCISDKTRWKWLPRKTLEIQWLARWWWNTDLKFNPKTATKKELLQYFKYEPYKLYKF